MNLVEQHIIKKSDPYYNELDRLCFLSKNLYNASLYEIRQHYFKEKKYIGKYELINKFTKENNIDFRSLSAHVSQQTVLMVDKNMQSFFKLLKLKTKGQYKEKINLPKYLKKDGRYVVVYVAQTLSKKILEGIIKLSKSAIEFKTEKKDIKQVRLIPRGSHIVMEVVYTHKEKEQLADNGRYASIDLGINNLATLSFNNSSPLIINGKPLKSVNQYYNKQTSYLKTKLKNNARTSKRIKSITNIRNNKVKDYLHKVSRLIINHLVSNQINTLIIGKNKEWKQEVNIGRVNNQNFVSIPHSTFIDMLKYKAKMEGINVIIKEESYTSKCSFMDNEKLCKHDKYLGERIKRGLFKTSSGRLVNADVNGSLNIMRKVVPNALTGYGIEVCSTPVVTTIKFN